MKYRADIDGLRTVAVLPVLGFHLNLPGFNGGYVGVDIFFVISGYLITTIIAGELAGQKFSFANFYRRRALRILPALLAVILVSAVLGWFLLLPEEYLNFGKAALAATFSVSNLFFFNTAPYGIAMIDDMPLVHTWSLAVEEQFYILWPIMLWAASRWLPHRSKAVLIALAVASLAFCILQTQLHRTAAFYLLPSRAWELAIGGLLALGAAPAIKSARFNDAAGVLGLLLIAVSIKGLPGFIAFPGPGALAPVLGAALIIYAGQNGGGLAGKFLSLPPMVFIGKISYSLYLWHMPVILYLRYGLGWEIGLPLQVASFAVSIILASLSWAYVEQPFRKMHAVPTSRVLRRSGAALVAMGVLSGAIIFAQGFPGRLDADARRIANYNGYNAQAAYRGGSCMVMDGKTNFASEQCLKQSPGKQSILLIGDTDAAHLWPGLAAYQKQANILQMTAENCSPLLSDSSAGVRCSGLTKEMLTERFPKTNPDIIILAARWQVRDLSKLPQTLEYLKSKAGAVFLVGPAPEYMRSVPRLLIESSNKSDPDLPQRYFLPHLVELDKYLEGMAKKAGVRFVSLVDIACPDGNCRAMAANGAPLHFDRVRLTDEGSAFFSASIWNKIWSAPDDGADNVSAQR